MTNPYQSASFRQMDGCFNDKKEAHREDWCDGKEVYGRMILDDETLFAGTSATFFEGPPDPRELGPNVLGVNIDIFRQIKDHYRKTQNNLACRTLADICMDIQDNGYIGRVEASADRLEAAKTSVQRWRKRFGDTGLLLRQNWNGRMSVNPKVAIRMDGSGKQIKPPKDERGVFVLG